MRTIAWCVLALSLVGCHSGPRWCMRDCDTSHPAQFDDQPMIESEPQPTVPPPPPPPKDGPNLTAPPQPAQKERTPYESSSRSRPLFGGRPTSQASRSKSSSRTTQTARRSPASATKAVVQDDSVKQLMADLEKTKREKAALESKLTEDSAKQTQQRLELEARLALLQEQMRQQSALQQVTYQPQQAPAMSQPMLGYAGPMITSGAPSPSMQMPFSPSTPMYAPQPQAVPAWNNSYASSPPKNPKKPLMALETFVTPTHQPYAPQPQSQNIPAWNNSASTWNTATAAPQQQVEQWPYSPQRR